MFASHKCGKTIKSNENGLNMRNWLRFLSRHESCHLWHSQQDKLQQPCITVSPLPCSLVRVSACTPVRVTVFRWLWLSVFGGGCCRSLVFLPWPAYGKAAVLITWSTRLLIRHTLLSWHLLINSLLFLETAFWISSWLCSLSRRNTLWRSLSIL